MWSTLKCAPFCARIVNFARRRNRDRILRRLSHGTHGRIVTVGRIARSGRR